MSMSRKKVKSVEITYEDGQVDHFITSAGDTIVCSHIDTYSIDDRTGIKIDHHYRTLLITPVDEGRKDAV